ncbi:MAG: heme-binding protein [Gammaproteobacteria bacterium]|nr:heme-binding protein [Gammaproteobacteria bacterium]MDH3370648.1 heme-binding protein [Gammaproteobacteria bacterium]MDH3405600.1 heme-binding protein [Gammaproteobacteria bacterium]MDH5486571.1 heme-binding protein [Gammaproteobacteria bacterium]
MRKISLALLGLLVYTSTLADDVLNTKLMSLDLARDIANATLQDCRKKGFNTAIVVVDRSGDVQVVLRDIYVSRHAIEIAQRKASAVVMSGVSTHDFIKNRGEIRAELNEVPGILLLQGGVPIRAVGSLIGAVGVSGAPGGEKDEACALEGIKAVQERLDFAT